MDKENWEKEFDLFWGTMGFCGEEDNLGEKAKFSYKYLKDFIRQLLNKNQNET